MREAGRSKYVDNIVSANWPVNQKSPIVLELNAYGRDHYKITLASVPGIKLYCY